MTSIFYVYLHKTSDGVVRYVGKGSGKRAHSRIRNIYWLRVFKNQDPIIEFVQLDMEEEDSFQLERKLIAKYRAEGAKLCNLTDGGEGPSGMKISEATRAQLSAMRQGKLHWNYGKHMADHVKQKLSEAHRRLNLKPMLGKRHSLEARLKMSNSRKGKPGTRLGCKVSAEQLAKMKLIKPSREHIEKLQAGKRAAGISVETRAKLSVARKGKSNGWSDETKAKMSAFISERNKAYDTPERRAAHGLKMKGKVSKKRQQVVCVDTGEVFSHALEAAEAKGLCHKKIQAVCSGKRATHGKLAWKYQGMDQ